MLQTIVQVLQRISLRHIVAGYTALSVLLTGSILSFNDSLAQINYITSMLLTFSSVLFLCFIVVDFVYMRKTRIVLSLPVVLAFLLLSSAAVSLFLGAMPQGSMVFKILDMKDYTIAVVVAFVWYLYCTREHLWWVPYFFVIYALLNTLLVPITRFIPDSTGLFADRNFFSLFFVQAMAFLFYRGLHKKMSVRGKIAHWAMWFILLIPVALSQSRSGLVLFVVLHGIVLLYVGNRRVLVVGLVLGVFTLLPFVYMLNQRVQTQKMDQANWSDLGRVAVFMAGVNMVKSHPIRGVGYKRSNQLEVFTRYKNPHFPSLGNLYTIHNAYLIYFAEQGVFGGGIFILLNVLLLWQLWRIMKVGESYEKNGLPLFYFVALLGYSLFSLIYHNYETTTIYWILVMSTSWYLLSEKAPQEVPFSTMN